MTVLKQQRGNCFEYASVLCSLLIAQGYDAYVVSGYATREVCLMDETREVCPLLIKKKQVNMAHKKLSMVDSILFGKEVYGSFNTTL